jgi:hypothetical protein
MENTTINTFTKTAAEAVIAEIHELAAMIGSFPISLGILDPEDYPEALRDLLTGLRTLRIAAAALQGIDPDFDERIAALLPKECIR